MKGGDVIIVAGAEGAEGRRRAGSHERDRRDDRRRGGRRARRSARRARRWSPRRTGPHVAIGFEDGPADPRSRSPRAAARRRGHLARQRRRRRTRRRSSEHDFGYGAIFEASRILNGFRERLAGEAHLTFNPGMMLGGTSVDFDDAQSTRRRRSARRTSSPSGRSRHRRSAGAVAGRSSIARRQTMREVAAGFAAADQGDADLRAKAIRRWRRPTATRAARDLRPARAAISASGRWRPSVRTAPAPPTSRSSRVEVKMIARRHRPDGARRPHAGRNRRSDDTAVADEACRTAAVPAVAAVRVGSMQPRRPEDTNAIMENASCLPSLRGGSFVASLTNEDSFAHTVCPAPTGTCTLATC